MLARGVYKKSEIIDGKIIRNRCYEEVAFYNHQKDIPSLTSSKNTVTTSTGCGLSGRFFREFSKLKEDEKEVKLDHVFNQRVYIILEKELQLYKTYKDDDFISISILFSPLEKETTSTNL